MANALLFQGIRTLRPHLVGQAFLRLVRVAVCLLNGTRVPVFAMSACRTESISSFGAVFAVISFLEEAPRQLRRCALVRDRGTLVDRGC